MDVHPVVHRLPGALDRRQLVAIGADAFDPYPFIFLNLVLSMLAALQAPVIMMSQNRQATRDRIDATHDYEVNLKAEIEIMALHEKLDELRHGQIIRHARRDRADSRTTETDRRTADAADLVLMTDAIHHLIEQYGLLAVSRLRRGG